MAHVFLSKWILPRKASKKKEIEGIGLKKQLSSTLRCMREFKVETGTGAVQLIAYVIID